MCNGKVEMGCQTYSKKAGSTNSNFCQFDLENPELLITMVPRPIIG